MMTYKCDRCGKEEKELFHLVYKKVIKRVKPLSDTYIMTTIDLCQECKTLFFEFITLKHLPIPKMDMPKLDTEKKGFMTRFAKKEEPKSDKPKMWDAKLQRLV